MVQLLLARARRPQGHLHRPLLLGVAGISNNAPFRRSDRPCLPLRAVFASAFRLLGLLLLHQRQRLRLFSPLSPSRRLQWQLLSMSMPSNIPCHVSERLISDYRTSTPTTTLSVTLTTTTTIVATVTSTPTPSSKSTYAIPIFLHFADKRHSRSSTLQLERPFRVLFQLRLRPHLRRRQRQYRFLLCVWSFAQWSLLNQR
jgi:hypothetical protein